MAPGVILRVRYDKGTSINENQKVIMASKICADTILQNSGDLVPPTEQ